jgi:hypothetical protein
LWSSWFPEGWMDREADLLIEPEARRAPGEQGVGPYPPSEEDTYD